MDPVDEAKRIFGKDWSIRRDGDRLLVQRIESREATLSYIALAAELVTKLGISADAVKDNLMFSGGTVWSTITFDDPELDVSLEFDLKRGKE